MKVYSDIITRADIVAALPSGVGFQNTYQQEGWFHPIREFTPRKRFARGFEFFLHGPESNRYASAHDPHEKAATWDEHGLFMAELFRHDADAEVGFYKGLSDFIEKTRAERDRVAQWHEPHTLYSRTHRAPWLKADGSFRATPYDLAA